MIRSGIKVTLFRTGQKHIQLVLGSPCCIVFFIHQLLFVVPESQEWDSMFAEKVAEFDDACHRSGISEESKISLVRDPTHHSK